MSNSGAVGEKEGQGICPQPLRRTAHLRGQDYVSCLPKSFCEIVVITGILSFRKQYVETDCPGVLRGGGANQSCQQRPRPRPSSITAEAEIVDQNQCDRTGGGERSAKAEVNVAEPSAELVDGIRHAERSHQAQQQEIQNEPGFDPVSRSLAIHR